MFDVLSPDVGGWPNWTLTPKAQCSDKMPLTPDPLLQSLMGLIFENKVFIA